MASSSLETTLKTPFSPRRKEKYSTTNTIQHKEEAPSLAGCQKNRDNNDYYFPLSESIFFFSIHFVCSMTTQLRKTQKLAMPKGIERESRRRKKELESVCLCCFRRRRKGHKAHTGTLSAALPLCKGKRRERQGCKLAYPFEGGGAWPSKDQQAPPPGTPFLDILPFLIRYL
jgi:hypothetical protein